MNHLHEFIWCLAPRGSVPSALMPSERRTSLRWPPSEVRGIICLIMSERKLKWWDRQLGKWCLTEAGVEADVTKGIESDAGRQGRELIYDRYKICGIIAPDLKNLATNTPKMLCCTSWPQAVSLHISSASLNFLIKPRKSCKNPQNRWVVLLGNAKI